MEKKSLKQRKQTIIQFRDTSIISLWFFDKWSIEDLAWYFNVTRQTIHRIIKQYDTKS